MSHKGEVIGGIDPACLWRLSTRSHKRYPNSGDTRRVWCRQHVRARGMLLGFYILPACASTFIFCILTQTRQHKSRSLHKHKAKMQYLTLVSTLLSSLLLFSSPVAANTTLPATITVGPSSSTQGCVTVTSVNGGSCPTPNPCTTVDCLLLSTVTLHCGCPSIYTERVCASTCTPGCGTTYNTVYIPCATSISSPPSSSTPTSSSSTTSESSHKVCDDKNEVGCVQPTSTSTSSKSRHSHAWNSTYTGSHTWTGTKTCTETETGGGNGTTIIVTSTSITTITSCPAKVTCHGQHTTWTGTEGPFGCSASRTCTCVLPGGTDSTTTGTGSASITGSVTALTTSATSTKAATTTSTTAQANSGNVGKSSFEALFVGLLGLVWVF